MRVSVYALKVKLHTQATGSTYSLSYVCLLIAIFSAKRLSWHLDAASCILEGLLW